jgi:hypothetical protein
MIVVERGNRLVIIRQTDHAKLASEFAARWGGGPFDRLDPAASMSLACAMHDEGWRDRDEEPLIDESKGRPLHFLDIDLPKHAKFYAEGVAAAKKADPYGGLLSGMHWTGLYGGRWGTQQRRVFDPKEGACLRDVVLEEERSEVELKHELWSATAERRSDFEQRLWMNYELLQAFDLLSLFVCMEDLADTSVTGTIGPVPLGMRKGDVDLQLEVREEGVVSIDPYPFDSLDLEVSVPRREIAQRYGSVEELRRAMQEATTSAIKCRFVTAEGAERDAASAGAVREA